MMSLAWGSLADTTVDTYTQHTPGVKAEGFNIGDKNFTKQFSFNSHYSESQSFFYSRFSSLDIFSLSLPMFECVYVRCLVISHERDPSLGWCVPDHLDFYLLTITYTLTEES